MKALQIVSMSLTGLLLFTTVVCGLWLRYSGEIITDSNKSFHMVSGLLTAVFVVTSIVLLIRE